MQAESEKTIKQLKTMVQRNEKTTKHFIRCRQGVEMYNMSRPQFVKLAIQAGAAYKINSMILVDRAVFEKYLDSLITLKMSGVIEILLRIFLDFF